MRIDPDSYAERIRSAESNCGFACFIGWISLVGLLVSFGRHPLVFGFLAGLLGVETIRFVSSLRTRNRLMAEYSIGLLTQQRRLDALYGRRSGINYTDLKELVESIKPSHKSLQLDDK